MAQISVTHFSDPGCPFAYSASPALAVLRWRYGSQLDWRLVTIGLSEDPSRYEELGYTPTRMTLGNLHFRRHGMPFAFEPRPRSTATARACRAIVAARLNYPGREYDVHRALQLAWFTSTLLLDDDTDIAQALARVPDLDAAAIVAAIDDEATSAGYEADKSETRQADGSPTEFQGKARQSDGPVRYSAPSLVFEQDGARLEAGGFQTIEAYDCADRQSRPDARARSAGRGSACRARPLPRGDLEPRGRRGNGAEQPASRPRRGRTRADRARRRRQGAPHAARRRRALAARLKSQPLPGSLQR
jgi:predicted DsbA family dithiol-disulfide isomerase